MKIHVCHVHNFRTCRHVHVYVQFHVCIYAHMYIQACMSTWMHVHCLDEPRAACALLSYTDAPCMRACMHAHIHTICYIHVHVAAYIYRRSMVAIRCSLYYDVYIYTMCVRAELNIMGTWLYTLYIDICITIILSMFPEPLRQETHTTHPYSVEVSNMDAGFFDDLP